MDFRKIMSAGVLALLFLTAAPLSPKAEDNPPDPKGKTLAPHRLGDIASRLSTDTMFAYSLADKLIDDGSFEDLVEASEHDDRASLRYKLIKWIRANPEDAAKRYSAYAKQEKPSETEATQTANPAAVNKILHQKMEWKLNEHFEGLSKQYSDEIKNKKLASAEDESFAGRRLFEGQQEYEGSLSVKSGGKSGNGQSSPGGADAVPLSGSDLQAPSYLTLPKYDWKLNPQTMAQELRDAAAWVASLRNELLFDKTLALKRAAGNNTPAASIMADKQLFDRIAAMKIGGQTLADMLKAEFSGRENILAKAAGMEQSFRTYASQYMQRGKMQQSEAQDLEKLRSLMRLELANAHMAARYDDIKRKRDDINVVAPLVRLLPQGAEAPYLESGRLIGEEGAELNTQYAALSQKIRDGADLDTIFNALADLEIQEKAWRFKWQVYMKVPELKVQLRRTGNQTVLDRIFAHIYTMGYPRSEYSQARMAIVVYKRMVFELTDSVITRNFAKADFLLSSLEQSGDPEQAIYDLETQIIQCVSIIRKARICNELNQGAFWELFIYRPVAPLMRWIEPRLAKTINNSEI